MSIAKIRYTHDAVIDMIIANPQMSQGELAREFGYSMSWLSIIMSSDAFRERLASRRSEIVDPMLKATLEERYRALAARSVEVLLEKLSAPSSVVSDQLAIRCAELGAKANGLGTVTVQQVCLPPDHLEKLAERLVFLKGKINSGEVYEVQAREVA